MGHIKQEAFSYSSQYTTRSPTNYKNDNCFFKSPVPFYEPILKFEVMIKEHHSYKLNGDIQLMATYMNCVTFNIACHYTSDKKRSWANHMMCKDAREVMRSRK